MDKVHEVIDYKQKKCACERKRRIILSAPFIHLSKSLVNEPPSRFPSGTPMERDARLQGLPLHNLQGAQ